MSVDRGNKAGFKRPRYAARACKECKRRKVKCDGETPCLHCDRYGVLCEYPAKKESAGANRSLDVKGINESLKSLQQQVNLLLSRDDLSQPVKSNQPSSAPGSSHVLSSPPDLLSSVPNNADPPDAYIFSHRDVDIPASLSMPRSRASVKPIAKLAVACHPILSISRTEGMRLIDIYEGECGSVYPFIDVDVLRSFALKFYDEAKVSQNRATWRAFEIEQSSNKLVYILELVLAIGLVIEDHGSTDLSSALIDEVEAEIDHRPSGVSVDIPFAEIMTLMSLYQFYRDEDVLAWRMIGLAARTALELGLHLYDPPFTVFQNTLERERTNRLFWSIYCLDKRWSFGTGLPSAIHESDIDPNLLEPNDRPPYIFTSTIAYSRIGSQILKALSGVDRLGRSSSTEDKAFLTYRVEQWYSSLDPELRVEPDQDFTLNILSSAHNRVRVLHYLRRNQLRMLIHRESLFTTTSITADPQGARITIDLAKDTIKLLDILRTTSEIYSSHPVCFNYFLYSALTVILLAVCRAKAQFYEYCRGEFHIALNLVGGLSAKSSVARRLWKIIKHLKIVGSEASTLPYFETQDGGPKPQPVVHRITQLSNTAQMPLDINEARSSLPSDAAGFSTDAYVVDGTLLSSELSDLFQNIDTMEFEVFSGQPSTNQTGQSFSMNVWNVL